MSDVQERMDAIRVKKDPNSVDILKYMRYAINVKKYSDEKLYELLSHWDKIKVETAIKKVEKENSAPRPKRYYVSLKEPLEDPNMR